MLFGNIICWMVTFAPSQHCRFRSAVWVGGRSGKTERRVHHQKTADQPTKPTNQPTNQPPTNQPTNQPTNKQTNKQTIERRTDSHERRMHTSRRTGRSELLWFMHRLQHRVACRVMTYQSSTAERSLIKMKAPIILTRPHHPVNQIGVACRLAIHATRSEC